MAKLHQQFYEQVFEAILSQRILPGTRLAETELSEIYGVSRSVIRRTLQRMFDEGLVELRQNRGASVVSVDREMAREIFEARRIVELGVVDLVCGRLDDAQAEELAAICTKESAAMAAGQRAKGLRLSAEFHLAMVRTSGNTVLMQYAENLMSRSALAIACLETESPRYCAFGEHESILRALREGDRETARSLMQTHLEHIEANLQLKEAVPEPLSAIFG